MNKEIELAKEIKNELESLPLFEEYERMKKMVDEDKGLKELRHEIKINVSNETQKQELLNNYNSHPLVANYNILLKEVSEYLAEISNIINKK